MQSGSPLTTAIEEVPVAGVQNSEAFRSVVQHTKDDNRDIALPMVAAFGQLELVQFFIEQCGADVNRKDDDGNTALMKAAETGRLDVVKYLVQQHGVDVNAKNKVGNTAVRLAADHGYHDIQRILTPLISVSDASPRGGHGSFRKRLVRWVTSLKAKLLSAGVLVWCPGMRLLCIGDAVEMANSVVSPSIYSSGCSIPPSEIELIMFRESGNIGGDFQAKWLDADAVVKLFIPDASHSAFNDEVSLWQRLRHPNVIKMYGACKAGPQLQFFVCEYASRGSLLENLTSASVGKATMWKFLYEAALGLEYLHERGIVHGDLCCGNILIGSDGIAKLSSFALSGWKKESRKKSSDVVGSMRWQAPEVLNGMAPSYESDVYALGMCVLEAATGKKPWGVWRMCCKNSHKRANLASVICELEQLAMKESFEHSGSKYATTELFDEYENGKMKDAWLRLQTIMEKCDNVHYCRAFVELKKVQECLQASTIHQELLARFHALLIEFVQMVTMSPEQVVVMRLSSTRVTTNSYYAIQWRIESLVVSLGLKDSVDATTGTDMQWKQHQNEQMNFFVAGVSDTLLLLQNLKTTEKRSAFLRTLRAEIETPLGKYTSSQLRVMKKAYEDISNKLGADKFSELIPEWFIPWYELVIDEWCCLGEGGFGSVYPAKWLDSEVVVKRVTLAGSDGKTNTSTTYYLSLSASVDPSATQAEVGATKRAEAVAMFRREVNIWFALSHPHVVRLFGACHVGRPFFVCEYATNGTLTNYLRQHPDELWSKLHEAALGVQYLHARDVVHGDLKGNNIVIGSDMKAKVTDFGLSSVTSSEEKPLVSGAWNWVAPELLDTNERPTFASDVYSLGMCVVEALRVVEAVKSGKKSSHFLPWCVGDRTAVRYHATHGKLPARPTICKDGEWKLVERMCVQEPAERIKISTVVDELETLAKLNTISEAIDLTDTLPSNAASWESIPEVVAESQELLASLQETQHDEAFSQYLNLWRRLEQVRTQIGDNQIDKCRVAFCSLVAASHVSTAKLRYRKENLVSLAERTMQCYALRRRLDKFCDAYFLACENKGDA
ncbi:hypothetical protein PF010_g16829 [Phytophthora fragariae]|uniref:Protein kinase domain-containing protein n=1 Tax=Phytophthora fragariae TaxID=53985 RepID=A0A6G0NIT4_9STRA|nr:hypothetical protein PF010_g16829 [Phytophthora fragariae]KAE9210000.1 hypothetical protein PF004_g16303 [Phytophthora fragariae]